MLKKKIINICSLIFVLSLFQVFENGSEAQPIVDVAKDTMEKAKQNDQQAAQILQESEVQQGPQTDAGQQQPAPVEKPIDKLINKKSIMFSDEDIKRLKGAMQAYITNEPLESILSESEINQGIAAPTTPVEEAPVPTEGEPVEQVIKEVPNFTLDSILFFNPDNWTLWLNGKQVRPDSAASTDVIFEVAKVTNDYVSIIWFEPQIDAIAPGWQRNFVADQQKSYLVNNSGNVMVHTGSRNIAFVLRPNQTLNTKTLEIVEGRILQTNMLTSKLKSENNGDVLGEQEKTEEVAVPSDTIEKSDLYLKNLGILKRAINKKLNIQ